MLIVSWAEKMQLLGLPTMSAETSCSSEYSSTPRYDAAAAASDLTTHFGGWADALSRCAAAQQLAEVDLGEDVAFSGKPDRFSVVPTYADRRIT